MFLNNIPRVCFFLINVIAKIISLVCDSWFFYCVPSLFIVHLWQPQHYFDIIIRDILRASSSPAMASRQKSENKNNAVKNRKVVCSVWFCDQNQHTLNEWFWVIWDGIVESYWIVDQATTSITKLDRCEPFTRDDIILCELKDRTRLVGLWKTITFALIDSIMEFMAWTNP